METVKLACYLILCVIFVWGLYHLANPKQKQFSPRKVPQVPPMLNPPPPPTPTEEQSSVPIIILREMADKSMYYVVTVAEKHDYVKQYVNRTEPCTRTEHILLTDDLGKSRFTNIEEARAVKNAYIRKRLSETVVTETIVKE